MSDTESHLRKFQKELSSGLAALMLLAVLARRGGVNAAGLDVVATVAGGLRVRDPAADLAVLFALASAVRDKPLPADTAFLGEIALSGTIRSVPATCRARRRRSISSTRSGNCSGRCSRACGRS